MSYYDQWVGLSQSMCLYAYTDQLPVTEQQIRVFAFATYTPQSLSFLNLRFQVYNHFLFQNSPVCVGTLSWTVPPHTEKNENLDSKRVILDNVGLKFGLFINELC